jgi:hypothetical protein
MRTFAVTMLVAMALAGCSGGGGGGDDGPITCPDGRVVEPEEHAHEDGMEHNGSDHDESEGIAADPCFIEPTVTLEGLPADLPAFARDTFTWTIDNGTVPAGHSMLTSFRYANESADESMLAGPDSWGTELVKFEHNNLPVSFDGTIFFSTAGTYYLRAYAEVRGTGYSSNDFWSEEFMLNVTPVLPTGVVVEITHGPGPFVVDSLPAGELSQTEADLALGDAVQFHNEHLQARDYALAGPACPVSALEIPAGSPGDAGSSEQLLFIRPGSCTVETDDGQAIEIRVAEPPAAA